MSEGSALTPEEIEAFEQQQRKFRRQRPGRITACVRRRDWDGALMIYRTGERLHALGLVAQRMARGRRTARRAARVVVVVE